MAWRNAGIQFLEDRRTSGGLAELSVAADRWSFHLDLGRPENEDFPLERLTDIRILFRYVYNHPPTSLGAALQSERDRLTIAVPPPP